MSMEPSNQWPAYIFLFAFYLTGDTRGHGKITAVICLDIILNRKNKFHIDAVSKNEKFWQATVQSNLADRKEDCSIGQEQLCEYENQTLVSFAAASHFYSKFDCLVAHQNLL